MNDRQYYVYILSNKKYGTLNIRITNNLIKRIFEHKNNLVEGFTKQYNLHPLIYFEIIFLIEEAIKREKQLKEWKRDWKIRLILEQNPGWIDLYPTLI